MERQQHCGYTTIGILISQQEKEFLEPKNGRTRSDKSRDTKTALFIFFYKTYTKFLTRAREKKVHKNELNFLGNITGAISK